MNFLFLGSLVTLVVIFSVSYFKLFKWFDIFMNLICFDVKFKNLILNINKEI